MKKRHEQKLVVLSLALLMAFNMPIILLFDSSDAFFGIPIIYIYLLSVWLLGVILTFIVIKKYYG